MRPSAILVILFMMIINDQTLYSQRVDTLAFIEGMTLLFDSDKDQLSNEHIAKIDSLLNLNQSKYLLRIEGHTDDVGSIEYNNKLAKRRTQSVYTYLVSNKQIDTSKIFYNSYGELKPAKSNLSNKNRRLNRRVDLSMYSQKAMRKIKGKVKLDSLEDAISAKINIEGKDFQDSTYTKNDGSWSMIVPDSVFVKLDISAPNHFFSSKTIKITEALDTREIKLELPKLEIGKKYDMPNFYFKSNLPILLPSSEPTLDLLYATMAESNVCIHIKGHVNYPNEPPVPPSHPYYKLSEARAKTVFKFLKKKGIQVARMKHSGYGNWQMVYPEAKVESLMKKNRRVEIEIIDCNF